MGNIVNYQHGCVLPMTSTELLKNDFGQFELVQISTKQEATEIMG